MISRIQFFIAVCGLAAGAAGRSETETTAGGAAPVAVALALAPVVHSTEAVPVRVTGLLARRTEADLAFKIGGIVEAVNVREGDAVTAGQELARLQLDEIDARVVQAHSALAKAERDFARVQRLEANAVATLESLEDARTGVEQARAAVRIAEFDRKHAVIVAPAAGRILRRLGEPDELVAAGRPMLRFASDADGWLVRVALAQADASRVRVGDGAKVLVGAREWSGRVSQIAGAVDPATRTTPVELSVEVPDEGEPGASGAVVAVTIRPAPVAARTLVPASALLEGEGSRARLYTVAESEMVARVREVEIADWLGDDALLTTDLPDGLKIVVRGAEFLRDGATVKPEVAK